MHTETIIGENVVLDLILEIVQTFRETQMSQIKKAAELLAGSLLKGGVIHVFGAGHSRTFGMEMCGRAGGLVPLNLVGLEDLARVEAKAGINLIELERDPNTANSLLELHDVRNGDAFILVSNSGINGSTVELALQCRNREIPVIAVTSLKHSGQSVSRHPSGNRLFEIADVVVDNCCPFGDVLLEIPDIGVKTGSASTVVGALIAQAFTAEIISHYLHASITPPVYISANVEGGDEHNKLLQGKYEHRNITY